MPEGNGTVALAFSGGLDTTVCVPLLKEEYGYDEVIGVTVDVGQPEYEFEEAKETAEALGVENYIVDAKEEFADLCLQAVKANADYQGYPLGTALARPVIAKAILSVAEEQGCDGIAHGCTGKGNDQLRFEAVWRDSDLEVIAPVRELGLTREWENEYAQEKGLPVEGGDGGRYSIDTNLDRMLGLKVRENYEHPAATVLLAAHEALEGLVLTQEERQFKTQIDQKWSEKAYEGLVDAPLVSALESFLEDTNERVTGTVTVKLEGGHCRAVSRESDYAVYSESAASFNEEDVTGGITQQDATGVAKYHGFQSRLANRVLADAKKGAAVTDGGDSEADHGEASGSANGTAVSGDESTGTEETEE